MFEQQLIETRRQKGDGKRWLTVPMSMVIHAAVVVGLAVVATLWAVDDLSEPPIPVSLYVATQAPAVPVGKQDGPKKPDEPKPPEEQKPRQEIVAPPAIGDLPEPLDHEEPVETGGGEIGIPGGMPSDGQTGRGGDLPFGELREEAPTPKPEEKPVIIRAGREIQEPRRISEVKPVYPEPARRAGLEGPVILEVIVDTGGGVRDLRVLRGMPLGMTEAAEDAVRRWRWEPAQYNGRPVEVYVIVTVSFRLR